MGEERMASTLNSLEKLLLQKIEDREVIEFARKIIRIPSENGKEGKLAAFLASSLRKMGLRVREKKADRGRPNVMGILEGRSKPQEIRLLLHGHTDTIPVLGMKNPFSGEVVDGYIWGRGSVDQKGGLAAAIMAIKALVDSNISLEGSVAIAAVIDEESEHRGSMALVDEGVRASFAIVTEPSDLRVLLACKGTAPIRIKVAGKMAHGSNPWLGINAIEKAAKIVVELSRMEPHRIDLPGLGEMRSSVNIGLIEGGTAYNNVANRCLLWLDRRMVPGETQESALIEIQALLNRLGISDPDLRAELEIARPDWKWERIRRRGLNPAVTSIDTPIVSSIKKNHALITGRPAELGYTHGYMDMDFLVNDLGIPTVNYGPGDTAFSHTEQERLNIQHLLQATRVYALTALDLAGPGS